MRIIDVHIERKQQAINKMNQKRLTNHKPMILASNCTGGFLYHWLGLQFRSPFINLYMTPLDFIEALENFDRFISESICEDTNAKLSYPVGVGYNGVKIHFMHYITFAEAEQKWYERISRMNLTDTNSMGIILSNWGGYDVGQLERFDALPFKNKVVFVDKPFPQIKSAFHIKGYNCSNGKNGNVYRTQYINGKRFIDQFDYVSFINRLGEDYDT